MKIYKRNGYMVVEMPPYVSPQCVEMLQNNFSVKISQIGEKCIIDMEKVNNLYSSTLRLLAFICRYIDSCKGKVYIVEANDNIKNALCSIGFDKKIPIYSSVLEFEIEHQLLGTTIMTASMRG